MSEEMDDTARGSGELAKRLESLVVIALIALLLYLLYLGGVVHEGPWDARIAYYMIVGIATVSLAVGMLIAIWEPERRIIYYLGFPYVVLIFAGAVYYMVLLSSIDFLGILFVLCGQWGLAYMIWQFKKYVKQE